MVTIAVTVWPSSSEMNTKSCSNQQVEHFAKWRVPAANAISGNLRDNLRYLNLPPTAAHLAQSPPCDYATQPIAGFDHRHLTEVELLHQLSGAASSVAETHRLETCHS